MCAKVTIVQPFVDERPAGNIYAKLSAVKIDGKTGERIDYGVLCTRVVTTAFCNLLVDVLKADPTSVTAIQTFKYHGCGTGTAGDPAASDTALLAEISDMVDRPYHSAAQEGVTANIYKSVGTYTFTYPHIVTEHGLFNVIAGGTLMDRSEFDGITVVATDSIVFTYQLTVTGE